MDSILLSSVQKKINRHLACITILMAVIGCLLFSFFYLQTNFAHLASSSSQPIFSLTLSPQLVAGFTRVFSLPLPKQWYFSVVDIERVVFVLVSLALVAIALLLVAVKRVLKTHLSKAPLTINKAELVLAEADNEVVSTCLPEGVLPIESSQHVADISDGAKQALATEGQVVFWQLPTTSLVKQNALLSALVGTKQQLMTWRALFTTTDLRSLLACAKLARSSQKRQQLELSSVFGEALVVDIYYQDQLWFGTLRKAVPAPVEKTSIQESNAQENSNQESKQLVDLKPSLLQQEIEQSDKLSEMIVRTMLQSQSVSIGSGITSWQVYRQLTRIFDWCRQTKIRAQLELFPERNLLSNADLVNELDGVALNVLAEVQLQRNQFYCACSPQVRRPVELDIRLFNRFITGLCRLLLAEQFNACLTLLVEPIQTKQTVSDHQRLHFSFEVKTAQLCKKVPPAIMLLADSSKSPVDFIAYIQVLMKKLVVDGLSVALTEQGYCLSFELEVLTTKDEPSACQPADFSDKKALYISKQVHSYWLLQQVCQQTGLSIIEAISDELSVIIAEQLATEHLERAPIDVVMLDGLYYREMYQGLERHLHSLPEQLRPKLFVLQNTYHVPLHQQGLFDQARLPLSPRGLQNHLTELFSDERSNNLILPKEAFSAFQFVPTQVEALLAVDDPAQHQVLIRLLNWLGLHVQVVCQPQSMSKYWRSGRYLLLFSELTTNPFVDFSAGKSIKRAIFTFSQQDAQQLLVLHGRTHKKAPSLEVLAPLTELAQLVEQLSPWLKTKKSSTAGPTTAGLTSKKIKSLTKQVNENSAIKKSERIPEKDLEQLQAVTTRVSAESTSPCLNLAKFADNQGSAELAAFMLSDYVEDILLYHGQLEQALETNNREQAVTALTSLIKVATILAVENIVVRGAELKTALLAVTSLELTEPMRALLASLQQAITELVVFEQSF